MGAYGGMAKNLFDGANVAFEDPRVAVDLYAYRPPLMEEIKKIDRHPDRAGGVSFVRPRCIRLPVYQSVFQLLPYCEFWRL
jgi:hypothetical protein